MTSTPLRTFGTELECRLASSPYISPWPRSWQSVMEWIMIFWSISSYSFYFIWSQTQMPSEQKTKDLVLPFHYFWRGLYVCKTLWNGHWCLKIDASSQTIQSLYPYATVYLYLSGAVSYGVSVQANPTNSGQSHQFWPIPPTLHRDSDQSHPLPKEFWPIPPTPTEISQILPAPLIIVCTHLWYFLDLLSSGFWEAHQKGVHVYFSCLF